MLSNREIWQAVCTHKDPMNGASTLRKIENGKCKCSICELEFEYTDERELTLNPIKDIIAIRIHGSINNSKMDLYFKNKYIKYDIPLDTFYVASVINHAYIYDQRIDLNFESFEDYINKNT